MDKEKIDITVLDEIDSTNNEAQRMLEFKNDFPFWIVANEQTSGRGRKNRYWVSQKGNFMGTFVLEHKIQKQFIPHLSFVVSFSKTFRSPGRISRILIFHGLSYDKRQKSLVLFEVAFILPGVAKLQDLALGDKTS